MNLHCIVQCFVEGDNKTKNIRNLFIIYLPLNLSLSHLLISFGILTINHMIKNVNNSVVISLKKAELKFFCFEYLIQT